SSPDPGARGGGEHDDLADEQVVSWRRNGSRPLHHASRHAPLPVRTRTGALSLATSEWRQTVMQPDRRRTRLNNVGPPVRTLRSANAQLREHLMTARLTRSVLAGAALVTVGCSAGSANPGTQAPARPIDAAVASSVASISCRATTARATKPLPADFRPVAV